MPKRKYDDEIEEAIMLNDQQKFEKCSIPINYGHISLMKRQKLKWINKDNYTEFDYDICFIKQDFMFKFDDVDNYYPEQGDFYYGKLHNAIQCLSKYIQNFPKDCFNLVYYVLEEQFINSKKILKILLNHVNLNSMRNDFGKKNYTTLLSRAILNQNLTTIQYLILNGAKFWDANAINTMLEQKFLIETTKSNNWKEASEKLSLCQRYNLRHKKKKSQRQESTKVSFLFYQLWHHSQYDTILQKDWNFPCSLHFIVKEYLYDSKKIKKEYQADLL